MTSNRRNFVKGSLGMLVVGEGLLTVSAQQTTPAARPQQTRNGAIRANLFPNFKPMRINTTGKS
jgi:hypothetical protein